MVSRRTLLAVLGVAHLAACANRPSDLAGGDDLSAWYVGSIDDEPFDVPLVNTSLLKPELRRQTVSYSGDQKPGTIVVDIDNRHLYLVGESGKAIRYGVGVGRQGFAWSGVATVGRKGVWPEWSPTRTMIRLGRAPAQNRKGGLDNPLGARALYLHQGGRDILFRIHGTNEPWSIGDQVSSGCIRMLNEDILDLYGRVPVGTTVLVRRNDRLRV
jgi:lipoprotein-anchoring transpeptidase ErfK/SrfK